MTNTLFCGTNFLPNQLLCRKYLATFLLSGGDFRSRAGQQKDQVSQTLYFLFKGCRARMMNYKPHAHSRTLALLTSSPMFSKRMKRKIKQCLCTGYRDFRHCRMMILKVYINGHENGRKSRKGIH